MIIPLDKKHRDLEIDEIADICLSSKRERDQLYVQRKKNYHFGTIDYTVDVKYNRIESHLDLVASFLYAADHCRFNIAAKPNEDEKVINQIAALSEEWNTTFRDCGLAYLFSDAVLWSLINDSMFMKLGWNDARDDLFGKLISPSDFSVYDESEPDLDSQEAFVHTYCLNWGNAVQRLKRAGKASQIKHLSRYPGTFTEQLPPVLANLIISTTGGPNISGPMTGRASVDYQPRATYTANSDNPMVRFHEIWVWDDDAEDYCQFIKADGIDGCLSDSRETIAAMRKADEKVASERYSNATSTFGIEQEHPFVHICPYPLFDFFWGKAHIDRLVPLQVWTNERLQQISDLLEQNVDPAKVASGFMGMSDEKIDALGGPGSWVMEMIPGAKVEQLRPPVQPDLFAEFKEIGEIFLDASGLTRTVSGHGEEGVRSGKQAKQAATTGSARIKKVAVKLEEPLTKMADIGVKLIQRNSKTRMRTDDGQILVAAQVAEDNLKMRVAGHSHSPLFADETKEDALVLHKANAIDREMLITMLNPPNKDELIHRLRKRVKAEEAEKEKERAAGTPPSGSHHKPKAAA